MAFAEFPASKMRFTAFLLNVTAAGYATWRLYWNGTIDQKPLLPLDADRVPGGGVTGWSKTAREARSTWRRSERAAVIGGSPVWLGCETQRNRGTIQ